MVRFTLRQLDFLCVTAETGGIAAAAREMGVSPAAIAAALDKLEDATGLTLFDRFPAQGMRLTPAGREIVARAQALRSNARALDRLARDLAQGRSGTIRLGTYYALAQRFALPIVMRHRAAAPEIRIEVVEADFETLTAQLDNREIDALLVFDQGLDRHRFEVEILLDLPPLVLLARDHPLAARARLSVADLNGLAYVPVSRAGPGPSYLDMLNAAGLHPEVSLSSQSYELVQAYVGKGLGFTLVAFPPLSAQTMAGDPVVALPLSEEIGRVPVALVRPRGGPKGAATPPMVAGFLDLCRSEVHRRAGPNPDAPPLP